MHEYPICTSWGTKLLILVYFFSFPSIPISSSLALQLYTYIGDCVATVQCYILFGIKRGATSSSFSSLSSLKPEKFYSWSYTFWPVEAYKGANTSTRARQQFKTENGMSFFRKKILEPKIIVLLRTKYFIKWKFKK